MCEIFLINTIFYYSMKEEPGTEAKERKNGKAKKRASASGGAGGSNLSAMFADVSNSFKLVCKSISAKAAPQAVLAPPPPAPPAPVLSTLDIALDTFTADYSQMFPVPDRLLFKRFLTDNDKVPGMFLRLDAEERLLFIRESIPNHM
jgi:hypothetical protein